MLMDISMNAELDLGLLQHPRWSALLYYHKALYLGCCNNPRSASECNVMAYAYSQKQPPLEITYCVKSML